MGTKPTTPSRRDLEAHVLAAALKQSFEQGDMSGAMLAHKHLTQLLKLKAEVEEGGKAKTSTEPAAAGDKRPIIESGREADQSAPGAKEVLGLPKSVEPPPAEPQTAEVQTSAPPVAEAQPAESRVESQVAEVQA